MLSKKAALVIVGAVFLLLDRTLKLLALTAWRQPLLWHRLFGWEPFLNHGIAFGIGIPQSVIIICTVPILFGIVYLLIRKLAHHHPLSPAALGLTGVLIGALSNWLDRVLYGSTIDYWRFGTGIINLADVLIVSGFVLYFLAVKQKKKIANAL